MYLRSGREVWPMYILIMTFDAENTVNYIFVIACNDKKQPPDTSFPTVWSTHDLRA